MKKTLLALALALGMCLPASGLIPATVSAGPFSSSNAKQQACSGITGEAASGECEAPGKSVQDIIRDILNLLSALIGIAAVAMIITAGAKYITAAGDSGKLGSAKSTLIYAVVGLVIVAMAQFLTQFVLKEVAVPATSTTTTRLDA